MNRRGALPTVAALRGDSEVENTQGHSFQHALEEATEAVVHGIHSRDSVSWRGMWTEFRR
jgi:hypothetical protein